MKKEENRRKELTMWWMSAICISDNSSMVGISSSLWFFVVIFRGLPGWALCSSDFYTTVGPRGGTFLFSISPAKISVYCVQLTVQFSSVHKQNLPALSRICWWCQGEKNDASLPSSTSNYLLFESSTQRGRGNVPIDDISYFQQLVTSAMINSVNFVLQGVVHRP